MKDMLGTEIKVADLVIVPAGNPRYGGLKLDLGIVDRMTEKRVTVGFTPVVTDKKRTVRTSAKTPQKLLVINDQNIELSEAGIFLNTWLLAKRKNND